MAEIQNSAAPPAAGWRLKLGGAIFVLSMVGPLVLLPLLAAAGFSVATTAAASGAILVGAEVLLLAAVAVMGKIGYAYIKNRVFGLVRRYGPPKDVGRARYAVGLVMFAVPIVFGWLAPYAGSSLPGYEGNETTFAVIGDLLFVASLFVLGGNFWDKVCALFIHDAKVVRA